MEIMDPAIKELLRSIPNPPEHIEPGASLTLTEINAETEEFIREHSLDKGVEWIKTNAPVFFPNADFEIEVLPADEGEDNILALTVYDTLPVPEFRKKTHAICEAMVTAGYKDIYEIIGIVQRRPHNDARQAISQYSSLVAA
ncbi:MAG: hypothetical protein ACE5GY_08555 [Thermodesulfobacteriota bacterium]